MRRRFFGILLALFAASAAAMPFELRFTGTIDSRTSNGPTRGDFFDFTLFLDPTAITKTFESNIEPDSKSFSAAITGLSGTLAGIPLVFRDTLLDDEFGGATDASFRNNVNAFSGDIIQFRPGLDTRFRDVTLRRIFIGLADAEAGVIDSSDFTDAPFEDGFLSRLETALVQFSFTDPSGSAIRNPGGPVDDIIKNPSPIPVPTTLPLLSMGLVLFGLLTSPRRPRQRKPQSSSARVAVRSRPYSDPRLPRVSGFFTRLW
jgi:hypothetical protein